MATREIASTGINWGQTKIIKRYKYLRRVAATLTFNLIYYPYWVVAVSGQAKGRWFPPRSIQSFKIIDGLQKKIYNVNTEPEVFHDVIEICAGNSSYPIQITTGVNGDMFSLDKIEIVSHMVTREEAGALAEVCVQKEWEGKFNRPWSGHVDLRIANSLATAICKPFWVITNNNPSIPVDNRDIVLDGTTGLVGMAEFLPVLNYWQKHCQD